MNLYVKEFVVIVFLASVIINESVTEVRKGIGRG